MYNETFTIGGLYRHPGGNTAHFNTAVEVTLSKVNNKDMYYDRWCEY